MRVNLLCVSLIITVVFVFYSKGLWLAPMEHPIGVLITVTDPDNEFYFKTPGGVVRPFSTTFALLSHKLAGVNPLPYTLAVRIVHCAVSLCIFYLMRRLTRNVLLGLFSALLYASFYVFSGCILTTEVLSDSFYAFFGILTLGAYVRYLETNNTVYRLASVTLFILALFSKESAIVLPLLIILVDFYYRHQKLEMRGLVQDTLSPGGVRKYGIYALVCLLYIAMLWALGGGRSFDLVTSGLRYSGILSRLSLLLYTIHYTVTPTFIWSTLLTKAFGLSFALSVLILFYYSDARVRNLLFFLACSTAMLLLPSCMFDLQDRYLYFPAVFSTAFVAVSIYYGVEKLFKSKLPDDIPGISQFKNRRLAIPLMLLLACYITIIYSNYRFVSRQIVAAEKASELLGSNVRDIVTLTGEESGKYDLFLLNFPCAVWGDLPFAPIIVWGSNLYAAKTALNFHNAISESVGNVYPRHIEIDTPYDVGRHYKYGVASQGEISASEFNTLAKDSLNKILLFDQEKEKVFDVSGKDYNSLSMLVPSF